MKKKQTNRYFLERFTKQENIAHEMSVKKQGQLKAIYREAKKELETDLAFFIERYSKENNLTVADMKKMLNTKERAEFRYTVEGYIKEIERLGADKEAGKEIKKELDILAGRTRVSRREGLIAGIKVELAKVSMKEKEVTGKHLENVVEFVYKDSMRILGNNTVAKLDPKLITNIVNQKWDSKNYSDRIWKNRKGLVRRVMKNVTNGIIQGHDFKKMSKRLAKDMNVGFYQARRLIETETTGALENAKGVVFREMGITKYQFIATIDDRTSEICRSLNGKVFEEKDRQIGVNCPFCHPFCRSVTVPYVDKEALERKIQEYKRLKEEVVIETAFPKEIQNVLEREFGKLNTTKVILRKERLQHIEERHPEVVEVIKNNFNEIIETPDYILKDEKNENTILLIHELDKKNLSTVVKLSLEEKYKNSVITSYKIRKGYLKNMMNNKIILKK
ncbi:minor capsid protein [Fusobacterium necrophorum]|uniref:Minor capsid protein n=1 Tax=Fusobacterium necrophorum TaxID=859 RepID=A0AAW6WE75_9FUSO|nr:minor capsid protein [Fusobacterium necrophorum]MDK4481816.1 minor capsid protein [Fusobacterium necrophorum]MDK4512960.1 minor capsid protein [Fusobacterium necrophorum]